MTLSDDEYVARVEGGIAHWRARNRAWMEACSRIEVDPVHPAASARFDDNGALVEFDVDPDALETYTNTELEVIITDVLRETHTRMHEQIMELYAKYLSPNDPRFDPNVLGEPYAELPD